MISGVPLLNLTNNKDFYENQVPPELVVLDFMYGKHLKQNNFILWWSKTVNADLGKDAN